MSNKDPESISVAYWWIYAGTILALVLAALFPEGRIWSLNWYSLFPWYGLVLLICAGVLAPVVLLRQRSWTHSLPGETLATQGFWPAAVTVIVIFVLCYILLSARTHFLGDGYQLLSRLEARSAPVRPWNIGTYFLIDSVYGLLGGSAESKAELAFRIVSWLSGLVFLGAAALTAWHLYEAGRDRLLFMLGAASGGFALQFFGYVENYPVLILLTACTTFVGLLAAVRKLNRWWILLPAAAALLVHPFAVALLPGTMFLILRETGVARWYSAIPKRGRPVIWITTACVAASVTIWLCHSSSFLKFSLVPLVATIFTVDGYTLFSMKHIADLANLLFLLLPALFLLLWALVSLRKRIPFAAVQYRFLLSLLIPSFLIVIVFDPGLGMPRDWDLFSFAGVPLAILLYYILIDVRNNIQGYVAIAAASLVLNFLVLVPRVLTQVVPDTSIALFESYVNLDVLRNGSGHGVLRQYLEKHGREDRIAAWEVEHARLFPHYALDREGQELFRQGKVALAEAKFRQAVAYAPNSAPCWANIGVCFSKREVWDSALAYFTIADGLNPYNGDTYNSLGYAYQGLGDTERALQYYLWAIRLDPSNFKARGNLSNLYWQRKQGRELAQIILGSIALNDVPAGFFFDSARRLLDLRESEAATLVCRRALQVGVDSSMITRLETDYPWYDYESTGPY